MPGWWEIPSSWPNFIGLTWLGPATLHFIFLYLLSLLRGFLQWNTAWTIEPESKRKSKLLFVFAQLLDSAMAHLVVLMEDGQTIRNKCNCLFPLVTPYYSKPFQPIYITVCVLTKPFQTYSLYTVHMYCINIFSSIVLFYV